MTRTEKKYTNGDILDCDWERWIVSYEDGKFVGEFDNVIEDLYEISDYEVIGNIHEDMHLLYADEESYKMDFSDKIRIIEDGEGVEIYEKTPIPDEENFTVTIIN